MRAIEERFGSYVDERPVVFKFEKWLQTHAGRHPPPSTACTGCPQRPGARRNPRYPTGHRGVPRSANSFARVAFNRAQKERVRVANGLHVPAQVIRAARWRIPTLVLIRNPRDAVLSFAIRDPISVDQALRYYLSFYETVEEYRDAYVLGTFEEVTGDFGRVIRRINDRFGTTFSPFRHNERNVEAVLTRVERNSKRRFGENNWENKTSRPLAARENKKRELVRELENPSLEASFSRAEAVFDRMTDQARRPVSEQ